MSTTVYIATEGLYSDHRIGGVFSCRADAERYVELTHDDGEVEEWTVNTDPDFFDGHAWFAHYVVEDGLPDNFRINQIPYGGISPGEAQVMGVAHGPRNRIGLSVIGTSRDQVEKTAHSRMAQLRTRETEKGQPR